jgi:hypothetical protein
MRMELPSLLLQALPLALFNRLLYPLLLLLDLLPYLPLTLYALLNIALDGLLHLHPLGLEPPACLLLPLLCVADVSHLAL